MSTPISDGGPVSLHFLQGLPQAGSLTLRDYFAGQALNGILLGHYGQEAQQDANKAAAWSYEQADAMLAQRERRT